MWTEDKGGNSFKKEKVVPSARACKNVALTRKKIVDREKWWTVSMDTMTVLLIGK